MERLAAPGIAILLLLFLTTSGIPEITPEQPQFFINISYEEEFSPDFSDVLLAVKIGDTITPIEANLTEYKKGEWAFFELEQYYNEEDIITYLDLSQYNPVQTEGRIDYSFEKQGTEGTISIQNSPITEVKIHNITKDSQLEFQMLDKNFSNAPEENPLQAFAINPKNIDSAEVTVIAKGYFLFKCKDWDYNIQECTGEWKYLFPTLPGHEYTINLSAADPGYMEGSNFIAFDMDDNIVTTNLSFSDDSYAAKNNTQVYWVNGTWNTGGSLDEIYFSNFTCEIKTNESVPGTFLVQWWNTSSSKWETMANASSATPPADYIIEVDVSDYVNTSAFAHTFRCYLNTSQPVDISIDDIGFIYDAERINLCGGITGSDKEYILGADLSGFTPEGICLNITSAQNITIDCNGSSITGDLTPGTAGVYAYYAEGISLRNCIVEDYSLGIYMENVHNSSISNTSSFSNTHNFVQNECSNVSMYNLSSSNTSETNTMLSADHIASHVYLLDTYNSSVENSTFYLSGDEGIVINGGGNNTIKNISIFNTTDTGFFFDETDNNTVYNVSINYTADGVFFDNSNGNTMLNMTISNYTSQALILDPSIGNDIGLFASGGTGGDCMACGDVHCADADILIDVGSGSPRMLGIEGSKCDFGIVSYVPLVGDYYSAIGGAGVGISAAERIDAKSVVVTDNGGMGLHGGGTGNTDIGLLCVQNNGGTDGARIGGDNIAIGALHASGNDGNGVYIIADTVSIGSISLSNTAIGSAGLIVDADTLTATSVSADESVISVGNVGVSTFTGPVTSTNANAVASAIFGQEMHFQGSVLVSGSDGKGIDMWRGTFTSSVLIENNTGTGLEIKDMGSNHFSTFAGSVKANENGGSGLTCLNCSFSSTVETNNNTAAGLAVSNATFYSTVTSNGNGGIGVSVGTTLSGNTIFLSTIITNQNGAEGINAVLGTSLTFSDTVTANGNTNSGLGIHDAAFSNTVTAKENGNYGIGVLGGTATFSDSVDVSENTAGFQMVGDVISTNTITADTNVQKGIVQTAGDSELNIVSATGNGQYGLQAEGSSLEINSLTANGNGWDGVYSASTTDLTFTGTATANGNTFSGFYLDHTNATFGGALNANSNTAHGLHWNIPDGTFNFIDVDFTGIATTSDNGGEGLFLNIEDPAHIDFGNQVISSGNTNIGVQIYTTLDQVNNVGGTVTFANTVTANNNGDEGIVISANKTEFSNTITVQNSGEDGIIFNGIDVGAVTYLNNVAFLGDVNSVGSILGDGLTITNSLVYLAPAASLTSTYNNESGINATSSYIYFEGSSLIGNNQLHGVYLNYTNASLDSAHIENNALNGVYLFDVSNASLNLSSTEIDHNTYGIYLENINNSQLDISGESYSNTIDGLYLLNVENSAGDFGVGYFQAYSNRHGVFFNNSNSNEFVNILAPYLNSGSGLYLLNSQDNSFEGQFITTTNTQYGIYFENADSNNFTDANITGSGSIYAIYLNNSENNRFKEFLFQGDTNAIGIMINNSDNNLFNGTMNSSDNTLIGVYLESSLNNVFSGNITANDNNVAGIYLLSADYNNFSGANISSSGSDYAAYLEQADYNRFTEFTLNATNNDVGLYLDTSSNNLFNGTLNLSSSNDYGLYLLTSNYNNFSGNMILSDNGEIDLSMGHSNYNIFDDVNLDADGADYGIYMESSNSNRFLKGSVELKSNSQSGIYMNASHNNIFNLPVISHLNTVAGIYFNTSSSNLFSGGINLSGNGEEALHFQNSNSNNFSEANITSIGATYGVYMNSSNTNKFENLKLTASQNIMALFLNQSSNNKFLGDITSEENLYASIYLDSSPYNNFTGTQTLTGSSVLGELYLISSAGNNFSGLNITGNNTQHTVYLSASPDNILLGNISTRDHGVTGVMIEDSNNCVLAGNITSNNSYSGVVVYNSDGVFLSGLDLNNNTYGLLLNESSEGEVQNSYARENLLFDLYVDLGAISDCDHTITNMIGSGNRQIIYYNDSSVFAGGEISELLLCNADDAEVYNANVNGSDTLNNNGILIINTDDAVIAYTNSSDNYAGLVVTGSNDNVFGGMELHRNNYSVVLGNSDGNMLINVTVSNTTEDMDPDPADEIYPGIYLDSSDTNELINISVYNTTHGVLFGGTSEDNIINTSEIYENDFGIFFDSTKDNYLVSSDIHSNVIGVAVDSADGSFVTYLGEIHDNTLAGMFYAGTDASGDTYLSNIVDNGLVNVYFLGTDAESEMIGCNISGASYGIVLNHTTEWITVNYTSINATDYPVWLQDNTSLFALINSSIYTGSTNPVIYFAEGSLEGPDLMPHTNIFYDTTIYSPQGDIIFFENESTGVNYFVNFAVCYNESTGCVMWENAQVNYTNLSLNNNIYLDPGFVSLNDSDGNATQFNSSAYITLNSSVVPCDAVNTQVKKKMNYPSTRLDIIENGTNYASASISCPSTETVRFAVNAFSGYAVDIGAGGAASGGGGADTLTLTVTPLISKFGTDVHMEVTGDSSCINNAKITIKDPGGATETLATVNGKLTYTSLGLGKYKATAKAGGCNDDSSYFTIVKGFLDLIVYPASLEKGHSVQLSVLDETGNYLSNATIEIVWPKDMGFSNAVLTSTNTNLTFTPPDLGAYTATATKQNYEPDKENFIVVQPAGGPGGGGEKEDEDKEIPEMERPGLKVEPDKEEAEVEEALVLTVTSMEDGSLLSDAKIYAVCVGEERFIGYTNETGRIIFTPWTEGICIIRAEKAGFVPDEDEVSIVKKAVEIPREETEETLEQKATAIVTQWGWLLLLILLLVVLIYMYKTKQKKGKKGKKRRPKKLKSKRK